MLQWVKNNLCYIQWKVEVSTTWHNIFNSDFDTVSFRLNRKSSVTFPLFSINNFMEILLKIKFSQEKTEMVVTLVGIYLFKVNHRNTRTMCETCSKLTIQIFEQSQWRCFVVFTFDFEQIHTFVWCFYCLTLMPAGIIIKIVIIIKAMTKMLVELTWQGALAEDRGLESRGLLV